MNKIIYMILTSQSNMKNTDHNTGFWLEELVAPYNTFKNAGYNPILVSVNGGKAPIDPSSVSESFITTEGSRFLKNEKSAKELESTISLQDINLEKDYSGLFLVGGHGTMWDFYPNPLLGRIIDNSINKNKPVGAVCHGVAGLLSYDLEKKNALKDFHLTGFSNKEEDLVGATQAIPFLLENELKKVGAIYSAAEPFSANALVSGLLITGQNPQSSSLVSQKMLEVLLK